ncbi:glycoside hydrolase family 3 protein [Kytococcus sp. Marseille-QA3725]
MRRLPVAAALAVVTALAGCSGPADPADESAGSGTGSPTGEESPTGSGGPTGDDPAAPSAGGPSTTSEEATSSPSTRPSSDQPSGQPGPSASPAGTPTWEEALQRARDLTGSLDVEELAGQVIVAGYRGSSGQDAERLVRDGFAGVIVFADNVPADPATLRGTTEGLQDAQRASGRDWPALVGVDQEGGPVRRIQSTVTPLPAGMAHGAAADADLSRQVARLSGQQLRALGFTMVFAPDADVTLGPQDPTIGIRSPGSDPERVADVVTALGEGYQQAGIVPGAKHFPGHGGLTTDSHVGLPASDASPDELRQRDLVPFRAAADAGLPIMVGHIALESVDDLPATLSRPVVDLLREELGEDRLVVTDAMNMGALDSAEPASGQDRAVTAVAAGIDLLLMPPDPEGSRAALVEAVRDGSLPEERLREAATRSVASSLQVGEQPGEQVLGTGDELATRLAEASLTSLGSCEVGTFEPGDRVRVEGGTVDQREGLGAALAEAGLEVGPGAEQVVRLVAGGDYAAGEVEDGGMPEPEGSSAPGSAGEAGSSSDVALALDLPYGLAEADAPVRLATFGDTPAQLDAAARALTGELTPSGELPVAVGDREVGSTCD